MQHFCLYISHSLSFSIDSLLKFEICFNDITVYQGFQESHWRVNVADIEHLVFSAEEDAMGLDHSAFFKNVSSFLCTVVNFITSVSQRPTRKKEGLI